MQNILDFEKDYPEAKVVMLEENYRSTKKILQAANDVINNNRNRRPKNFGHKILMGNKSFTIVGVTNVKKLFCCFND